MRKNKWCFGLAACVLMANALPVHAEHYTGGDGWKAQFTGKGIEQNFAVSDLSEAIYALQPGDSITIQLTLENQAERAADWYMTNEASSLEDSQSTANGGAYTYELTYTDQTGAVTTLYSSENVGGEKDSAAGKGLHEATDSLEEFFYLDRLESKGSGTVALTVALDGETQGNGYQNTLAKLQMGFAAAPVAGNGGGSSGSGGGDGSGGDSGGGDTGTPAVPTSAVYSLGAVQTGDNNQILIWSALALACGLGLMIFALKRVKEDKGGKEHEA